MQVSKNLNVNATIYEILDRLLLESAPYFSMGYKEANEYLMVQCPYHKLGQENKPSAQFRKEDGLFFCHNCKCSHSLPQVIGDVVHADGVEWLRDNFEVTSYEIFEPTNIKLVTKKEKKPEPKYIKPSLLDKYRKYSDYMLNTRHIKKEILDLFEVCYDEERKEVLFPVKDIHGNILFVAIRSTETKYFHYPDSVDKPVYGLYELEQARKAGAKIDKVFVVESMIDALSIWSWGGYAIALNGTGSAKQYEQIMKADLPMLVLATDQDTAGYKARQKFHQNVKGKFIYELDYEGYEFCKDINDMTEEQFWSIKIVRHSELPNRDLKKKQNIPDIIKINPDDTPLQKELVRALQMMDAQWEKQSDDNDKLSGFIYSAKTVEEVKEACEENEIDLNYALHRWFNAQVSLTCEDLFVKYGAVDEANSKHKLIDFYIKGEPFDLKVTTIPDNINFTPDMTTRNGRDKLIEWLYKNQSQEGRKHFGNRLFIVCDGSSTKNKLYMKTRFDLIEQRIKGYMKYTDIHGFNTVTLIDGDDFYPSIKSDIIYVPESLLK